jgi:outer membrane lipoprotein-sorting protein
LTDPAEKGLAVVRERKARDAGWGDMKADMVMTLRNAAGKTNSRKIRSQALEMADDGDLSLAIFDHPLDIKGTSFLTHTHILEPDEQWLYLPALKRVKRINAKTRSGPFMGSEFAYEDMSSFEVEKYDFEFLRDERLGDVECYVSQSQPRDPHSGYSRMVSWIDKQDFKVLKVDYYDRRGELLKTLQASDYSLYEDRFWRASTVRMVNHQTGKSTDIDWDNFQFGTGLSAGDFDKNSLKRAR